MDKLEISALTAHTHIGIHAWEQRIRQRIMLDISIPLDIAKCDDKLASTIDYDRLCREVTQFVETNSFGLIETLAVKVREFIKKEFKLKSFTLRVSKPDAVSNAGNISVLLAQD